MGLSVLALLTACGAPPEAVPASATAESSGPLGSPSPLASPRPTLAAGQKVFVGNTDRRGAEVRQAPDQSGALMRTAPDGAVLEATGRAQQADDIFWSQVRDSTGIVGWVNADYVSATPPPLATPTPMAGFAPPPQVTSLPTLLGLPTATVPTLGPRPTDTLVPIMAPAQRPALAPLPPEATARPTAPPLPPLAPIRPTEEIDQGGPGQPTRPAGTAVPTRRPAGR